MPSKDSGSSFYDNYNLLLFIYLFIYLFIFACCEHTIWFRKL